MYNLRTDWEKLNKARKLLEDGPVDWLEDDDDVEDLYKILNRCEENIRDVLSVKELGAIENK